MIGHGQSQKSTSSESYTYFNKNAHKDALKCTENAVDLWWSDPRRPNQEPRKEYRPRDCDIQTEPSTNDADAAEFSLNDWEEWFA